MGEPFSERILTANNYVLVTPGPAEFTEGACVALWVETAGSANLTTPAGADVDNFPLQVGLNPVQAIKVRAASAAGIWALYNR